MNLTMLTRVLNPLDVKLGNMERCAAVVKAYSNLSKTNPKPIRDVRNAFVGGRNADKRTKSERRLVMKVMKRGLLTLVILLFCVGRSGWLAATASTTQTSLPKNGLQFFSLVGSDVITVHDVPTTAFPAASRPSP